MAKQLQLKTFGFMQYLEERHFNWTESEKKRYFGNSTTILDNICRRLYIGLQSEGETGDDLAFEFAGINHDKDTSIMFDGRLGMEVIQPVNAHIHGVVTLSKKRDINVIANWVGLEPQFIEAPKRGRYGRENMLSYLIHAKSPDKYQYLPTEVKTFDTFDYISYWENMKPSWDRQKATVKTKQNKVSAHWLVKQVQEGLINKRDIMKNDLYSEVYADNMPIVNDAIQFYGEKKGFETLEALENGDFELSVIFITGKSGSGKTFYAQALIKNLLEVNNWNVYAGSPSNVMDGYNGEEVVLLDDLRANSMGATDWLQMLDARTSASMSARYKNRQKAYRTIVITSYLSPQEYFSYVKGSGGANEALDQFIRRIMFNIKVHRLGDGGRLVEIEAIGQSVHPIIYDVSNNKYISPCDNTETYNNGVPKLTDKNNYSELQLRHILNNINYKSLYYNPYPIFKGDPNDSIKLLSDIVKYKNNPELDHSKTERPELGNQLCFEDIANKSIE